MVFNVKNGTLNRICNYGTIIAQTLFIIVVIKPDFMQSLKNAKGEHRNEKERLQTKKLFI